jgi:dynein heavy chain 2
MNIHLFDEILDLISFSERVLSKPGGCILMAGRSGVGRKTATQLVSHMLNMTLFSPNISRDYGMKEFKRDLKQVM